MAKQPIGIPLKVLHETEGYNITIILSNNGSFTGKVEYIDDFMNITLSNVVERDSKNSNTKELQSVFIKGSEVVSIILPEKLANSPSLKNQESYLSAKKKKAQDQTNPKKRVKLSKS